jgi:hypothetical protein
MRTRGQTAPRPAPTIAALTANISGIPGEPCDSIKIRTRTGEKRYFGTDIADDDNVIGLDLIR